jgi:hypothetical protein
MYGVNKYQIIKRDDSVSLCHFLLSAKNEKYRITRGETSFQWAENTRFANLRSHFRRAARAPCA